MLHSQGYTNTGINNLKSKSCCFTIFRQSAYVELYASFVGEFYSIADQVYKNLPEVMRITYKAKRC